jgi:hypothetical protein
MNLETFRSAGARTRQVVTRPRWWGAILTLSLLIIGFAAATPIALLIKVDMMRGVADELSLRDETSLLRLLLPILGIVVAFVGCALFGQFVVEVVRTPRAPK